MMGGNCQFLGYPYGNGWPVTFDQGTLTWLPYVKHCGVSALPQGDKRFWTLDGINNAGFSGGPVTYLTGPQQQVFAVISGYLIGARHKSGIAGVIWGRLAAQCR